MPSYTDPTLVPGFSGPPKVKPYAVVALAAGAVCAAGAGYLFLRTSMADAAQAAAASRSGSAQARIAALRPVADEIALRTQQAAQLHQLFDAQQRYPIVLKEVEGRLLKGAIISSLQLTEKGVATLSGTVTDYVSYAKFIRALQAAPEPGKAAAFTAVRPTAVSRPAATEADRTPPVSFTFALILGPGVTDAKNRPVR